MLSISRHIHSFPWHMIIDDRWWYTIHTFVIHIPYVVFYDVSKCFRMLLWCFVTFNDWQWFWYQKLHKKTKHFPVTFSQELLRLSQEEKAAFQVRFAWFPSPAGEVRKIISPKVPVPKKGDMWSFPWKVITLYIGWVYIQYTSLFYQLCCKKSSIFGTSALGTQEKTIGLWSRVDFFFILARRMRRGRGNGEIQIRWLEKVPIFLGEGNIVFFSGVKWC